MDRLIHKDRAGNTLYGRGKNLSTIYAKNADGELLRKKDSDEVFALAKRQGKLKGISIEEFKEVYKGKH